MKVNKTQLNKNNKILTASSHHKIRTSINLFFVFNRHKNKIQLTFIDPLTPFFWVKNDCTEEIIQKKHNLNKNKKRKNNIPKTNDAINK